MPGPWRCLPALMVGGCCAVAACGGESADDKPGGAAGAGNIGGSTAGSGEAGGASGGDDMAGAAGERGSLCPPQAPGDGNPCGAQSGSGSFLRADCSYGDDPRPNCRTSAFCQDGGWRITPPDASCSEPPLPAACPAAPPSVGDPCSDSALKCWYEDGTHCECSECLGGSPYPICQTIDPPEWACAAPPDACPNPLPQAGEPCSDPGLSCGPSCEHPVRCQGGVWVYEQANCPICAAPDTPIATPVGDKAIAELRPGDLVYSVDDGAIVAVPILRAGSTRVTNHQVVRLLLDDGGVLEVSPGHPTADGRRFADLAAGSRLDERHVVVRVALVPYGYERTYDILPASSTGTYFAAGSLVASSLAHE